MRFDDPEMKRIYEESIQAKDYSGLVYTNSVPKAKISSDLFKLDVHDKIRQYSNKTNLINNEQNAAIFSIITIIMVIIFILVFAGIPLYLG